MDESEQRKKEHSRRSKPGDSFGESHEQSFRPKKTISRIQTRTRLGLNVGFGQVATQISKKMTFAGLGTQKTIISEKNEEG